MLSRDCHRPVEGDLRKMLGLLCAECISSGQPGNGKPRRGGSPPDPDPESC